MNVLVDTTVWSIALRRRRKALAGQELAIVRELEQLVTEGRALLAGPVRQEILTGVREPRAFTRLRDQLRHFDDVPLATEDFETAAQFANDCLEAGIAVTSTDLLLCAAAIRAGVPIFTTDANFSRYRGVVPLGLHVPRNGPAGD